MKVPSRTHTGRPPKLTYADLKMIDDLMTHPRKRSVTWISHKLKVDRMTVYNAWHREGGYAGCPK